MKTHPFGTTFSSRSDIFSSNLCLAAAGVVVTAAICLALAVFHPTPDRGLTANSGTPPGAASWFTSSRWRTDARTLVCAIRYLLEDEDKYDDPAFLLKETQRQLALTNPPSTRPRA
jgi:hypothetical protein